MSQCILIQNQYNGKKEGTQTCSLLDNKSNLCKHHGKDKPQLCKLFPMFPEDLVDVKEFCGFGFIQIKK